MSQRVALILGVGGQDGSYLSRLLLEKGYAVHGSSRDHESSSFQTLRALGIKDRVTLHSVAINDFRSVLRTIKAIAPDEIYNLAGQTSVGLSFDQPVEAFESIAVGTLNIVETMRLLDSPIRLFCAGSSECFGNTSSPANETTPFQPRSPYAMAKAAAFWSVANYREAYRLHACTGILFNHESPLRPSRFVTRKIVSTAVRISRGSGERLKLGNIDIARDWGWAPEYVEAMWRMLQADQPDDFVIATGASHSLRMFVSTVFAQLGLNWQEHVDVDPSLFRPTDLQESVGDPRKAMARLGWRAGVQFDDLIRALVTAETERAEAGGCADR